VNVSVPVAVAVRNSTDLVGVAAVHMVQTAGQAVVPVIARVAVYESATVGANRVPYWAQVHLTCADANEGGADDSKNSVHC